MSKLPKQKVISLAEGIFIRNKENIICVEASGTGKTHTAIALGLSAIQGGYRTRFIKAVDLVQELLAAKEEFVLPKLLNSWNKLPLVLLDELGYLGLGPGGPLLFQFCAEPYESGSFIITTNLEFSCRSEVFGDVTLITAFWIGSHTDHTYCYSRVNLTGLEKGVIARKKRKGNLQIFPPSSPMGERDYSQ